MTTREVFRRITSFLDRAGIAHMVTGSFAASYHGAPRATQDIDLIIRKSRPFSLAEFERRTRVDLEGVPLYVASPEDVVIAKLEWSRRGGSERQVQDTAAILRARRADLDLAYIER